VEIYTIPEERRYWVVRADNGKYYEHFTRYGIIALGHLDGLNLSESGNNIFQPNTSSIEDSLKKLHESLELKNRRTSTHLNQVKSFLREMKVGDWVLTVGSHAIRFGRIIGAPRLDKTPLPIIYDEETGRKVVLEYNLRRKVAWGPSIKRNILPFGLLGSLKANQTLFNIDYQWDAVYHSLYPAFKRGKDLYLSARINTENKVKNYSVVSLLNMLNEIEVISKELENGISPSNFDQIFKTYASNNQITVTTKAEFHSPGEIWNAISAGLAGSLDTWPTYAVIAYAMLFGHKKLGFDGIIDLETRQKLWSLVINRMKNNNIENVVNDLELSFPNAKTEKLETDEKDEQL